MTVGTALTMRVDGVLGCLILLTAAASCTGGSGRQGPAAASPHRISVCGVDRSGSYDFVKIGIELCARVVAQANAGDEIVVRWISDASYGNEDFVERIKLPNGWPPCTNPFDARCRRERAAFDARLVQIKRATVERLVKLQPARSRRTDILGFLQAAADELSTAPAGVERWIYVATDLEENVHHPVSPDLKDVRVVVFALKTGRDPVRAVRLRNDWQERLRSWGVVEVAFHAAEVLQ